MNFETFGELWCKRLKFFKFIGVKMLKSNRLIQIESTYSNRMCCPHPEEQ